VTQPSAQPEGATHFPALPVPSRAAHHWPRSLDGVACGPRGLRRQRAFVAVAQVHQGAAGSRAPDPHRKTEYLRGRGSGGAFVDFDTWCQRVVGWLVFWLKSREPYQEIEQEGQLRLKGQHGVLPTHHAEGSARHQHGSLKPPAPNTCSTNACRAVAQASFRRTHRFEECEHSHELLSEHRCQLPIQSARIQLAGTHHKQILRPFVPPAMEGNRMLQWQRGL
jgi:hypothetical protein